MNDQKIERSVESGFGQLKALVKSIKTPSPYPMWKKIVVNA